MIWNSHIPADLTRRIKVMASRLQIYRTLIEDLADTAESLYNDDSDFFYAESSEFSKDDYPDRMQNDAGEWILS